MIAFGEPEVNSFDSGVGRASAALLAKGAARVPHRWKSLMAHLRGTYDILHAWDQPPEICLAGLMHSVYSTEIFATNVFDLSERGAVKSLIGDRAEELCFLFATLNRNELFGAINSPFADVVLKDRFSGRSLTLTQRDVGDLLPIYMANIADQANARDGSPSMWLANVAQIGRQAARCSAIVPPVFHRCTVSLSREREAELLNAYLRFSSSSEYLSNNDFAGLASQAPYLPEPWIWLGLMTLSTADAPSAARLGPHARAAMKAFGVTWDRRLSAAQWTALVELLEGSSGQRFSDLSLVAQAVTNALENYRSPAELYNDLLPLLNVPQSHAIYGACAPPVLAGLQHETESVPERFATYISGFGKSTQGKAILMRSYPGLSADAYYDAASFPLAVALERFAPEIIKEFHALRPTDFHPESESLERKGNWDIFTFIERGKINEQNCQACPVTSRVILENGGIQSLSGLAYFSRLAPGTKIAPHKGPTNMRLRCHLGIKVSPLAGIRVDGEERSWTEGKCLVLNDSLTHEAWNLGSEERVVLVVDLWHPDLTGREVDLIEGLQRYAYSHANSLEKYWEKNERARNDVLTESGSNGARA